MAVEQISENVWVLSPGPFDVHAHPRALDALVRDDFVPENRGVEGKAGLDEYTRSALEGGIVGIAAMPNEALRRYEPGSAIAPEQTVVLQHPIATLDRVYTMHSLINTEANIPTAVHYGIDPAAIFSDSEKTKLDKPGLRQKFREVRDECTSIKFYFAETTGGNNVDVALGPELIGLWHEENPERTIVCHVEGSDVNRLLLEVAHLPGGKDIPIHIAHVSSRVEMEAILLAKRAGMNVTCEVTPHHLFLDESARELIGGGGCMKPSLKSEADRDFLWEHIDDIDIFASDCAPHRPSDKMGEHPAYGVTNHTVMLPLLLGAVKEGRLTMDDVYQKFCINPRTRFGLPVEDGSFVKLDTHYSFNAAYYDSKASYLDSPFRSLEQLGQRFRMVGQVVAAQAGVSTIRRGTRFDRKDSIRPSLTHLIRPKNLTTQVLRAAQERA